MEGVRGWMVRVPWPGEVLLAGNGAGAARVAGTEREMERVRMKRLGVYMVKKGILARWWWCWVERRRGMILGPSALSFIGNCLCT